MTASSVALRTSPARPTTLAPNGVIGMLVFVAAETMLFGGFISAFGISKASAFVEWPPPGQPRLPVAATALNTCALLASGAALLVAWRARHDPKQLTRWLLAAIALGAGFVVAQGMEWAALLAEGLTVTTSTHAGFFYIIVGAHAAHAVGALIGLALVYGKALRQRAGAAELAAIQVLWYFVVLLWPVLYVRVYL